MLAIVAAYDLKRGIGFGGKLPWSIPAEMKLFRKITLGHSVIMGRITFQSIGKPLAGRKNFVLSSTQGFSDVTMLQNFNEVKALAGDLFVIGGAEVFAYFLPLADRLYLSEIQAEYNADCYFPKFDQAQFKLTSEQEVLSENSPAFIHRVYQRITN